jgi:hypothetical protein
MSSFPLPSPLKGREVNPLLRLKREFQEWLFIAEEDIQIIDYVASIIMSIQHQTTPVWGYLVGPSGGVKSEILRAFKLPFTYYLDMIRPTSIISGFRGGSRDPSILPELNKKVLIIKDFSPILSMPRDMREVLFSAWRASFDGEYIGSFGNIGKVGYKSSYGIIIGCTSIIDVLRRLHAVLGERFLSFRLQVPNRKLATRQAIENTCYQKKMRRHLHEAVIRFVEQLQDMDLKEPSFSPKASRTLIELSDLTARCRSQVLRTGSPAQEVHYLPEPEIGTRLSQQLRSLMGTHAICSGRDELRISDLKLALRVARDSLPSRTSTLLNFLYWDYKKRYFVGRGKIPPTFIPELQLTDILGMSTPMVRTLCEDLWMLGILERKKGEWRKSCWRIKKDVFEQMDYLSLWTSENLPDYLRLSPKKEAHQ